MSVPSLTSASTRQVVHVVATDRFAGVESYVANVAVGLRRLGWSVAVIGGEEASMRKVLGGAVEHQPIASVREAAHRLQSMRPSIVHAHMTAAEMAALVSKPWHRSPIVVTRHFAAPRGSSPLVRLAGRFGQRFFAGEIAISEFVRASIDSPTTVIPNGVPVAPAGPHDQLVVLMAQRLEQEKDTSLALEAWRRSSARNRGWRLQIAGEGSMASELKSKAQALGIDSTVEFLGFRRDLDALRSGAAIFLATAPREPLGLSVLEAMASGLPVIAAGAGGHLETVGEVAPQLLFPPGDYEQCAALIDQLSSSPELRKEWGNRLRQRQRTRYDLTTHTERLDACYASVLGQTTT